MIGCLAMYIRLSVPTCTVHVCGPAGAPGLIYSMGRGFLTSRGGRASTGFGGLTTNDDRAPTFDPPGAPASLRCRQCWYNAEYKMNAE